MNKVDFEELEIDLEPYKKELKEMYPFLNREEIDFIISSIYRLLKGFFHNR